MSQPSSSGRATRLVTFVEVADPRSESASFVARHELELSDGDRVLLLDDRGWATSEDWATFAVDDVEGTARVVVGPDEPFDDCSTEDMAADHWAALQQTLRAQGVQLEVAQLRQLRHDVELSPSVRARLVPAPLPTPTAP